ncbi:MAG TPA: hypothetical protein PKV86_01775 [Syntrophobacteraceae bacterium]|nr:hypothetical protein [Syntrophobacteraceae bacterium]
MEQTFLADEKAQHIGLIKQEGKAADNEQEKEELDPDVVFVLCVNCSKPPRCSDPKNRWVPKDAFAWRNQEIE